MFYIKLTLLLGRTGHWKHLRLVTARREVGRRDTMPGDRKGGEFLVLGDWIIRIVGTEYSEMKFECFPGTRTE
jgi:hypothetical protein